jgi:hypothetical protein
MRKNIIFIDLFRPETLLERKSTLFSIVVTLAVFITLLATMAYLRLKTKRLLLSAIAFGNFIAAEAILIVDATWPNIYDLGELPLLEVGHLLTFTTLGLLAIGVFRND